MKEIRNRVTKEQLEKMKEELLGLTATCDQLLNILKDDNITIGTTGTEFDKLVDYTILDELESARSRKREIEDILKFVEVIPESKDEEETIKIGSTFKANFGKGREKTFILVETLTCLSVLEHYISVSSPLGKNVYGKKVGDNFSYPVNGTIIEGSIVEIAKTKEMQKVLK